MASPSAQSRRRPDRLPVQLTSFVGRRQEVADLKRRLTAGRLVTITGPGGVGKTRLAVRAGADLAARYRDGVWFVELGSVTDPLLVTDAVVAAFGIQNESSRWSVSGLTDYLSDKRLLLVLDNCEHVLDAAALLAGALLRACPDLRILATSRQALGIAGETVQPLEPMAVPEEGDGSAEAAARSDAVVLFLERAGVAGSAAGAGGVADGPALAAIHMSGVVAACRQLDGIPLALELAAGRLRTLGVGALGDGLGERALAFATGDRSAPPRQQTLQATIEWSYRLLTVSEQLLWTRLSVFAGGFELDAAEAVCADDELPAPEIRPLVAALVDKSLVVRSEGVGRARFHVLQVLRQFGQEQLRAAGTADRFRLRHAEWVSGLGAQLWANDEHQGELFGRIRAERTNVWAALDFCVHDPGEAARGIAICRDLWAYWQTERPVSDVLRILDALLARVDPHSQAAGAGLWVSAFLTAIQGDLVATSERAARALAIGRATRDPDVVAWALDGLAAAAWHDGRWEDAERLAAESFGLGQTMGLQMPSLVARYIGVDSQLAQGNLEVGLARGEEAIRMSQELGESWVRSYLYNVLALAFLRQGRPAEAEAFARRCLVLRRDLGDVHGMARTVDALAAVATALERPERAATLLGGADSTWRAVVGNAMRPSRLGAEEATASVRVALGAARFEAAFRAGRDMARQALIDFALGDGDRPVVEPRRESRVAGPLSRRELEIARLVAAGATNGETADQLFISERTVESHMASIFNKLGLDSRVHVARWVANLDPAEVDVQA